MTLGDLLLENRIVFLGSSPETGGKPAITDYLANITIQKLLFLQYENRNQEIHLYINCPGGSVTATLAIYDTMQFLECPISTYCMGLAASGAAIILAAGTKGKRYALPNSKVMIHQPWGQVGGQVSDIEIQANEILKDRDRLNEILAKHTGQPVEQHREGNRARPLLLLPRRPRSSAWSTRCIQKIDGRRRNERSPCPSRESLQPIRDLALLECQSRTVSLNLSPTRLPIESWGPGFCGDT